MRRFDSTWSFLCAALLAYCGNAAPLTAAVTNAEVVRVFIFAGQSNMEGADSRATDIERFPPFAGLDQPQDVRFAYCLGRENKTRSPGWTKLQPVNNLVGPELSFARKVQQHSDGPIAIIKIAAGGTHLGGDWNPDHPSGFKMYPLALEFVRENLAALEKQNVAYRLEGFMWHQGENDMFNEEYMQNYGANLQRFLARWRRDLESPDLRFYIGELCTKTIWGMDLRPRMHAIQEGQRAVTNSDPRAEYVPTAHVGVEIGNPVGLHYHYGTLGQLGHGSSYADAYLRNIDRLPQETSKLASWPYPPNSRIRLFVLAGHRNMQGERAFVKHVRAQQAAQILQPHNDVAFRYSMGGDFLTSAGWEPLRPVGFFATFGPELSFVHALKQRNAADNICIAKFTHGGSQLIDWTPAGSVAKPRHIYPKFVRFVKHTVNDLRQRGHAVDLQGIFYHVGENEMSMPPYRKRVAEWLKSTIKQSRVDLDAPHLRWFVTQQKPTDHERVNSIDVTGDLRALALDDDNLTHTTVFDLPPQEKRLVLDAPGIFALGREMATAFLTQPAHP